MPFAFRHVLLAGALTAAALGTSFVAPATADAPPPPPGYFCVSATAQVDSANAAFVAARAAFVATDKPLGVLLAHRRTAVRAEVRAAKVALRQLHVQVKESRSKAAREALVARIRAERATLHRNIRLLESRSALRAHALADRQAATKAFVSAGSALEAARVAADVACG